MVNVNVEWSRAATVRRDAASMLMRVADGRWHAERPAAFLIQHRTLNIQTLNIRFSSQPASAHEAQKPRRNFSTCIWKRPSPYYVSHLSCDDLSKASRRAFQRMVFSA
jgi:hypothetical protein